VDIKIGEQIYVKECIFLVLLHNSKSAVPRFLRAHCFMHKQI
jgi:hypothetical protein